MKDALESVLKEMPEDRLRQVLDFACFLAARSEEADWRQFGVLQLSRAYGTDEAEYSEADIKPKLWTAPAE